MRELIIEGLQNGELLIEIKDFLVTNLGFTIEIEKGFNGFTGNLEEYDFLFIEDNEMTIEINDNELEICIGEDEDDEPILKNFQINENLGENLLEFF